jgi:hypothetical protein
MTNHDEYQDQDNFYHSLHPLERETWHQLHELFQLVQPRKPEKGIRSLILRARALADTQALPLEIALAQTLASASERTHKRVELLNQCALKIDIKKAETDPT